MSLLAELKRRNVFRVGAAYIVASWLVVQVVETIFPAFGFEASIVRTVVVILAIFFVPALVFAWVFELTPEGLKREYEVDRAASVTATTGKRLDRIVILMLAVSLTYFAVDKFILSESREASIAESARDEGRTEAVKSSYGNRSIAVLPFDDISPERNYGYLSDGIAEELLNRVARLPELRVISRASAFSFRDDAIDLPEIAKRLSVSRIIEGSVRTAGNRVRISVRLYDAASDTQSWSDTYDHSLDDIFALQDEVAAAVIEQLEVSLDSYRPSLGQTTSEAYLLFLQAQKISQIFTQESQETALGLYERVVTIDPFYEKAWNGVAASLFRLSALGAINPEVARETALQALRKSLEINPDSVEALRGLAWQAFKHEDDLQKAASFYEKALRLSSTNVDLIGDFSVYLNSIGRTEESIRFGEYQVSRDPASTSAFNNLGMRYRLASSWGKAVSAFEQALVLNPSMGGAYYEIGVAKLLYGDIENADKAFEMEPISVFAELGKAMTACAKDNFTFAKAKLRELEDQLGNRIPVYLAHAHAYCSNADEAFKLLRKGRDGGDSALSQVLSEPLMNSLHSDGRWNEFLASIGRSPEDLATIELSFSLPTF